MAKVIITVRHKELLLSYDSQIKRLINFILTFWNNVKSHGSQAITEKSKKYGEFWNNVKLHGSQA